MFICWLAGLLLIGWFAFSWLVGLLGWFTFCWVAGLLSADLLVYFLLIGWFAFCAVTQVGAWTPAMSVWPRCVTFGQLPTALPRRWPGFSIVTSCPTPTTSCFASTCCCSSDWHRWCFSELFFGFVPVFFPLSLPTPSPPLSLPPPSLSLVLSLNPTLSHSVPFPLSLVIIIIILKWPCAFNRILESKTSVTLAFSFLLSLSLLLLEN